MALLRSFQIKSAEEMQGLGQSLAPILRAGDCVALRGQIGAGKSVLSRSVILTLLDVPEDIPSPTFTIVQTYEAAQFDIWHCDLYRLTQAHQVDELGLEDAMQTALCLIEWPEIMADYLPQSTLYIDISGTGETRTLALGGDDEMWATRLGDLP